jgi:hypothetical protein
MIYRARFGMKSLLITVTVVSLWLSTLTAFTGSNDVQAFIWIAIVVSSGAAAVCYKERRRAFWGGFFVTMLIVSTRSVVTTPTPGFTWAQQLSRTFAEYLNPAQLRSGRTVLNVNSTLILVTILVVAALMGLICVHIYDQSRK